MEDNKTEILDPDPSLEYKASGEWQISPREYNERILGHGTTLRTTDPNGAKEWKMLPDDAVYVGTRIPSVQPEVIR